MITCVLLFELLEKTCKDVSKLDELQLNIIRDYECCRTTSFKSLMKARVVTASDNAGKFVAINPALSETCSFHKAFSLKCNVLLKPSLKRHGLVVKTRTAFRRLHFSWSIVCFAAPVFCCANSNLPLIVPSWEGMYKTVRLSIMLVRCERWIVRTMSYRAAPNSRDDPKFLWRRQVGETSEYRGVFHSRHQIFPSTMLWIFEYNAEHGLKAGVQVRFPHSYGLTDTGARRSWYGRVARGGDIIHSFIYRHTLLRMGTRDPAGRRLFFEHAFISVVSIELV